MPGKAIREPDSLIMHVVSVARQIFCVYVENYSRLKHCKPCSNRLFSMSLANVLLCALILCYFANFFWLQLVQALNLCPSGFLHAFTHLNGVCVFCTVLLTFNSELTN